METVRERTEAQEAMQLSSRACLSAGAHRLRKEATCNIRTAFQRDRDRVIHSASFRRLKHKTQVFLAPEGDHYRTRLTHTLEVSQIARTIARALQLNEDLTEAIALGHDLGHTPFGHAGERALNACLPGGFRHYEHSVRVVNRLEKDGRGLNLTLEVQNGILCHTKGPRADTLEGRIVEIADKIAYINHDIDDAVKAGVLSESDIPPDIREGLGQHHSQRINTMVRAVIDGSDDDIAMLPPFDKLFYALHDFMYQSVYTNPVAKGEEHKAEELVQSLFAYYTEHADMLPGEFQVIAGQEGVSRAAADYIAGMTDRYAVDQYTKLFVPRSWSLK